MEPISACPLSLSTSLVLLAIYCVTDQYNSGCVVEKPFNSMTVPVVPSLQIHRGKLSQVNSREQNSTSRAQLTCLNIPRYILCLAEREPSSMTRDLNVSGPARKEAKEQIDR